MNKVLCLIAALTMWILQFFLPSEPAYLTHRIDSSSNLSTSNTDIYYADFPLTEEWQSSFYHYSIPEDRLDKLVQTDGPIVNMSVKEPWIYYVRQERGAGARHHLLKYNICTGEEQILFESDNSLVVIALDDYLLYHTSHDPSADRFFVCPIDGDLYEDSIDLSTIFTEEDRSGNPQYACSYGLIVERTYDKNKELYHINFIRQAGDEQKVLFNSSHDLCSSKKLNVLWGYYGNRESDFQTVYLNGEKITLSKGKMTKLLLYQREEEDQPHVITCLSDKRFEFSDFRECLLTTQGDEIIGLLTVYIYDRDERWWRPVPGSGPEVLFRLNPKTGESSILYDSQQQSEAIIGYDGELVYLVHNRKVYSWSPEDQKQKKLFKLLDRDAEQYVFDWQGDYLIVYCGQDLERVYKVK